MDINCGEIVDSNVILQEVGECFFQMIFDMVLGKKIKSELYGYGQDEFVFWYIGVYI